MKRNNKPVVRFQINPKTNYIGSRRTGAVSTLLNRSHQNKQQTVNNIAQYNENHSKFNAKKVKNPHIFNYHKIKNDDSDIELNNQDSYGIETLRAKCYDKLRRYNNYQEGDDDEEIYNEQEEDEDDDYDSSYDSRSSSGSSSDDDEINMNEAQVAKALAAFRKCDEFLQRHNIRPDVFKRYRERLALQAWLLQRVAAKAARKIASKYI